MIEDGVLLGEEGAVVGVGASGGLLMPLEVANPEHELGDGGGAAVDFESVELGGADFGVVHL